MKVYLLRHGEIEDDGQKRVVGQTDVPLSEKGKSRALWWRTALDRIAVQGVYCSDLVRARQTAEILTAGTATPVTIVTALREINLGHWDGLAIQEVKALFPGEWEKRGQNLAGYRPVGGESFSDLFNRVVPAFEEIIREAQGSIVVVSHAGVNRMILCHVLGMPIDNIFRLRQDYGALNIIECSGNFRRACIINLTSDTLGTH